MPDGQRFDPEQFMRELEPVLTRPHDEVDQLLRSNSRSEQQLALHHPNLTEDHLIRFLHDHNGGVIPGMLESPVIGDRLRQYAIEKHEGLRGLIRSVRDPAYLHHVIENVHAGKYLGHDWMAATEGLKNNPHVDESHGQQMLEGKLAPILLPYVHNAPKAVNEFAQKQLSKVGTQEEQKGFIGHLFGHPDLNPQLLEDFVKANPQYAANPFWIEAVAKRHENAGDLLARNIPPEFAQTVNWDDYNTTLFRALEKRPELQRHPALEAKLFSHPKTSKDALDFGIGSPQTINTLARTSTDVGLLKKLARQQHPAADEGTLNAILDRKDLVDDRELIANAVLRQSEKPLENLEDSTLLRLMRYGNPERMREGVTKSFPSSVVNAALNSLDHAHWHPIIAEERKLPKEAQMNLAQKGFGRDLSQNKHLHPEVISYLLNSGHLDNPEQRGSMLRSLIAHHAFSPQHHEQLRAVGGHNINPAVRNIHLQYTPNPQHVREEFDKMKDRLAAGEENLADTEGLEAIFLFGNRQFELPDDILQAGLKHGSASVRSLALSRTKQRHYDSMLDSHPEFVADRTNDPKHLEHLVQHSDDRVRFAAYRNSNTPTEVLKSVLAKQPISDSEKGLVLDVLKARDPDLGFEQKVGVRYNTGKLRRIRDYIESVAGPGGELRMKDLPEKLAAFVKTTKIGMNPKNGNVNANLLQQHIDNQPANQYNVSHSYWGGIQRHNSERSNVFQLNVTTDHVRQMQQAGVYDTFRKLQDKFRGHPITDTAFGWVRYTGKPGTKPGDGIFVDEVQSDHFVPLAEKARAQAIQHSSGLSPEQAKAEGQRAFDRVNQHTPADHQKKINQILFGKKHASEVLLEAFHQHLRDQGHIGTKIAIHSVHSKAPISLGGVDKLPDGKVDKSKLPGHFVHGYEVVPQSMGMEPSTYHKDNMATQDSHELQDKPTHQETLRKKAR